MENFKTIGAFWYSRPETLKQCTNHFLDFLIKLRQHNPIYFTNWYETGMSKNDALKNKIELNYLEVKKLFSKKGKEDDYPKTSFSLSIWDGAQSDTAITSLSASLGSSESKYYTNNCIIEMPFDATKNDYYNYNKTNQSAILELLKDSWHPEWISVNGKKI